MLITYSASGLNTTASLSKVVENNIIIFMAEEYMNNRHQATASAVCTLYRQS